jgi:Cof subfamily protein (haloacid dehalogenase superfamily)
MIKCIASDMDGTLLTGSKGISEKNIQAIKLAQASGIEFVIATGRSYPEAQLALKEANIICPVICVNGAEVRAKDGSIVSSHPLSAENATRAAKILENNDIYYEVYTNKGTFTMNLEKAVSVMIDVFTSANHRFTKEQVEAAAKKRIKTGFVQFVNNYHDIFNDPDYDIYKFLAFSPDSDKLTRTREALRELEGIAVSSSGDGNLEITSTDAQKGVALEDFVKKMGISLIETMAIGDNDNDLSMLMRVGRSVAMGNAADHIKDRCHFVTASNEEDGVAEAIFAAIEENKRENGR